MSFIKELKKRINTENLEMTTISRLISDAWRKESTDVKKAYKKISDEVGVRLECRRRENIIIIDETPPSPRDLPSLPPPEDRIIQPNPLIPLETPFSPFLYFPTQLPFENINETDDLNSLYEVLSQFYSFYSF